MLSNLAKKLEQYLKKHYGVSGIEVEWKSSLQTERGDFSTAVALQSAKAAKIAPLKIAEELICLVRADESVAKADMAGGGYINIWLTPQALFAQLNKTRQACTPRKTRKKEQPMVIEYSGPNIAKPLGVHHILSTVIGQAIVNLNIHLGYNVVTTNHIGDWGTQFGKLAVAFKHWAKIPIEECSVEDLLKLYVRFHNEAEKNDTLEEEARKAFLKIEQGDKAMRSFWKKVVDISVSELLRTYERLQVKIDNQFGESKYLSLMQPIVEEGLEKGVFKAGKEGAIIADFPEDLNLPAAVVLKGDKATIYHTRDLATIRFRIDTWHPEAVLYVVDRAQELYFKQLFAMVKALGWKLPHLEHIIFGRMSFSDRQMSTRKGNILRLEEVLDEAVTRADKIIDEHGDKIQTDDREALAEMMGVGAVAYSILSQNRKMDMVFDWEKILSFEGNSAPYLQYTHARASSILRKAAAGKVKKQDMKLPVNFLFVPKERKLLNTLLKFSQTLDEARKNSLPHVLANYLFSLCQDFNSFYNDVQILKSDLPERQLRLELTALTASVLKTGAGLLTIRVPEKM